MFKVFVLGKSINELKSNLKEMYDALVEGDDDTNFTIGSQVELPVVESPAAIPAFPAPTMRTATETIAAEGALKEHLRSISNPSAVETRTSPMPPIYKPPVITTNAAPKNDYGLDSRGIPWDERIHSVSQGINKDGSWRTRRGVEPAVLAQVETELRQRGNSAPSIAPPTPAPVQNFNFPFNAPPTNDPFTSPVTTPPVTISPVQVAPIQQPSAELPPPTNAPTSVVQLPSAHTFQTFKENLVAILTRFCSEGKLTTEWIAKLKIHFGVEQIWQVNDVQLNEMFEHFVAAGLIAKV